MKRVVVNIYLKEGVLDPQGKAVHHALDSLGFGEVVEDVRIGKQIVLKLNSASDKEAKEEAIKMCESLLANTVIENYDIEISDV
ncbi:MAG TPA: phosphoribosylformylglycinamidine synthase subunit PurS [Campylobacterales bacterium]|nr:phosphoribosylformylglycinamidine synthase subunit PurS [Campylobacterales bacterium]HIO71063.1 phosphoribosylformylglycinamidine synthase subunit PurS [Campylobacterales bacterium]